MNHRFLGPVLAVLGSLVCAVSHAEALPKPPADASYLTAEGRIAMIGSDGMQAVPFELDVGIFYEFA